MKRKQHLAGTFSFELDGTVHVQKRTCDDDVLITSPHFFPKMKEKTNTKKQKTKPNKELRAIKRMRLSVHNTTRLIPQSAAERKS